MKILNKYKYILTSLLYLISSSLTYASEAYLYDDVEKIKKFINLPSSMGKSVEVAIIEIYYTPALFSSNVINRLQDKNENTIFDVNAEKKRIEESFKTEIIDQLKEIIDEATRRSKRALSSKIQKTSLAYGKVINIDVSFTQHKDSNRDNLLMWSYALGMQHQGANFHYSGEDLSEDNFNNLIVEDCMKLYNDVLDFETLDKEKQFQFELNHGNNVINSYLSVNPKGKVHVGSRRSIDEIAKDTNIKIVSFSTYHTLADDILKQDALDSLILEKFECFKNTGKLLIFALPNEHKDISRDLHTQSFLKLINFAENNNFSVLLCSATSLEESILGMTGYLTENTPNLAEISAHYITSPGFKININGKNLIGSSHATPIAAAGIAFLAGELGESHFDAEKIKKAIVLTGRKKSDGERFNPSSREKIEFINEVNKILNKIGEFKPYNNIDTLPAYRVEQIEKAYKESFQEYVQYRVISESSPKELKKAEIEAWENSILRTHLYKFIELNILKKVWNHIDVAAALKHLQN